MHLFLLSFWGFCTLSLPLYAQPDQAIREGLYQKNLGVEEKGSTNSQYNQSHRCWLSEMQVVDNFGEGDKEFLEPPCQLPEDIYQALHHDSWWGKGVYNDVAAAEIYRAYLEKTNNPCSAGLLGSMASQGRGMKPDNALAYQWLTYSSEKKCAWGTLFLGDFYQRRGHRDISAYESSLVCYRQAAAQGNAIAMHKVACMLFQGLACLPYPEEAQRLWQKAGGLLEDRQKMGRLNVPEKNCLAWLYSQGKGVVLNPSESFRLWHEAADRNYPEAQFNVGLAYLQGSEVPVDLEKARSYLEAAAFWRHPGAQRLLGLMHLDNLFPDTTVAQGLALLRASADQGDTLAQDAVRESVAQEERVKSIVGVFTPDRGNLSALDALFWESCRLLYTSVPEAIEHLRQAISQGSPKAVVILAQMFSEGLGVARNEAKAEILLMRVCEKPDDLADDAEAHRVAMCLLGMLKERRSASPFTFNTAMDLYTQAAKGGDSRAQMILDLRKIETELELLYSHEKEEAKRDDKATSFLRRSQRLMEKESHPKKRRLSSVF